MSAWVHGKCIRDNEGEWGRKRMFFMRMLREKMRTYVNSEDV